MSHFLKYQFPAILWAGVIFLLSSIHHIPTIKFPIAPDKIAHLAVFSIFCFLCWRAFNYQTGAAWIRDHAVLIAFLCTCLYGFSDEFHQRFVPGRTYDLYDWLADSLGGLTFVMLHGLMQIRKKWQARP